MRSLLCLLVPCMMSVIGASHCAAMSPQPIYFGMEAPRFWDGNAIALIEVTGPSGGDHIPVKLLEQFYAGTNWKAPVALSLSGWTFIGAQPGYAVTPFVSGDIDIGSTFVTPQYGRPIPAPNLKMGDHLLIAQSPSSSGTEPVMAMVFASEQEEKDVVMSCETIRAAILERDPSKALAAVIKSGGASAERFMINRLADDPRSIDDALMAEIVKLRTDASANIYVRMNASMLIEQVHLAAVKTQDWVWLCDTLKSDDTQTREEYDKLVYRLIYGHAERRVDNIELFCGLATDSKRPVALRTVVVGRPEITQLLDSGRADAPENLKVVAMLSSCLQDPSPTIRWAAGNNLWRVVGWLNARKPRPAAIENVTKDAVRQLDTAAGKETDHDLKLVLTGYAENLRAIVNSY